MTNLGERSLSTIWLLLSVGAGSTLGALLLYPDDGSPSVLVLGLCLIAASFCVWLGARVHLNGLRRKL